VFGPSVVVVLCLGRLLLLGVVVVLLLLLLCVVFGPSVVVGCGWSLCCVWAVGCCVWAVCCCWVWLLLLLLLCVVFGPSVDVVVVVLLLLLLLLLVGCSNHHKITTATPKPSLSEPHTIGQQSQMILPNNAHIIPQTIRTQSLYNPQINTYT